MRRPPATPSLARAAACRRAASTSRCVSAMPGARRAHDVELGRRRLAGGDRVERTRRARRVALHRLVHALGEQRVAHRVDGVVERHQRVLQRVSRLASAAASSGFIGAVAEEQRRSEPAALHLRCSTSPSTTLLAATDSTG